MLLLKDDAYVIALFWLRKLFLGVIRLCILLKLDFGKSFDMVHWNIIFKLLEV